MPKYDFKCNKCDSIFEIIKSMAEDNPTDCECGGKLSQVFHATPVTFKGGGFYKTGG